MEIKQIEVGRAVVQVSRDKRNKREKREAITVTDFEEAKQTQNN